MISDKGILYIVPSANVSPVPLIDEITKKMTAAFRLGTANKATRGTSRGFHTCACGQRSTNASYTLPNGQQTNALCVHYLAWHRQDITAAQLTKVKKLNYGESVPNEGELRSPHPPQQRPKRPPITR